MGDEPTGVSVLEPVEPVEPGFDPLGDGELNGYDFERGKEV